MNSLAQSAKTDGIPCYIKTYIYLSPARRESFLKYLNVKVHNLMTITSLLLTPCHCCSHDVLHHCVPVNVKRLGEAASPTQGIVGQRYERVLHSHCNNASSFFVVSKPPYFICNSNSVFITVIAMTLLRPSVIRIQTFSGIISPLLITAIRTVDLLK